MKVNKVRDSRSQGFLNMQHDYECYYPEPYPVMIERNFLKVKRKVKIQQNDNKYYLTKKIFHAVQHGYLDTLEKNRKHLIDTLNFLDEKNSYSLLHYACLENQLETVAYLLNLKANVNIQGSKGVRPIHLAAQMNHFAVVERLCQHHSTNKDVTDVKGQTALLIACRRCHKETIEVLLRYGVDISKVEADNISVLHHPVRRNNLEIVKLLVKNGAPLNIPSNNGQTPLMIAATEGHEDIFKFYLNEVSKLGHDVHCMIEQQDNDGFSCLSMAVQNKNTNIVKLCLENDANMYITQVDGQTIFHTAAVINYTQLFEFFKNDQLNLNVTDIYLNTPLHLAVINDNTEMVKVLISKSVAVNACNRHFQTPLILACKKLSNTNLAKEIQKALVDFGNADLSKRDDNLNNVFHYLVEFQDLELIQYFIEKSDIKSIKGIINSQNDSLDSPLHVAARIGNVEICKLLLQTGANPLLYSDSDFLPLHVATSEGHLECVKILLDKSNITSSVRNADEVTPIHLAASHGRYDVFNYLISIVKDPFAKDEFGRNVLMFASRSGCIEIVRTLINMNANINLCDQMKNTALHEAANMGNLDVVQLLWKNGASLSENLSGHSQFDSALRNHKWDVARFFVNDENWMKTMTFRHKNGDGHMKHLIKYNEIICSEVLDKCLTENTTNKNDPNYEVKYWFGLLDAGPDDHESINKRNYPLKYMGDLKKESLLKHPVTNRCINLKWTKIGLPIFIVDFLLYCLYLSCITGYIYSVERVGSKESVDSSSGCQTSGNSTTTERGYLNWKIMFLNTLVYTITGLRLLVELIKIISQRLHYLKNIWNYFFVVTNVLVFFFIDKYDRQPCAKEWTFAPPLILISWFDALYYIQHFPVIGLLIVMFMKVLISAVKVIIVFSVIIIGFSLAFSIVNDDVSAFNNVGYAYLKSIAMMIGEIELVTYFISNTDNNYHSVASGLVMLFMLVLPIALFNLLVGIAVGDIGNVIQEATVETIRIKIYYFYSIESNLVAPLGRRIYESKKYENPKKLKKSIFNRSEEEKSDEMEENLKSISLRVDSLEKKFSEGILNSN